MATDFSRFNLVPNAAPLGEGIAGLISDQINSRLQKKALGGEGITPEQQNQASAKLASRDPRASAQIGSILQGNQAQGQAAQAKQKQVMASIARTVASASPEATVGTLQSLIPLLSEDPDLQPLIADIQEDIERFNTDPQSVIQEYQTANSFFSDPQSFRKSAGQRETEDRVQALVGAINPETKEPFTEQEARQQIALVDSGIVGRAQGSADQTITKLGTAGDVAKTKEILAGGAETGILDAQGRLQPNIDKQRALAKDAAALSTQIFGRIDNIEGNIRNMNEGISLIDQGANVGPVDKWLPSFKPSTVKIDNLKARLGLDVISSITFGALSAKELEVAFDTAVPPNLNDEGLKVWFQDRIKSQEKLLGSLEEAGIFLAEKDASIPKLMAKRRAERKADNVKADSGALLAEAEAAIAAGADREAVMQRLQQLTGGQ
jgi:hypothetical protein